MNRIDRLLGIVLELQRKRTLQAEGLASLFEVSARTIYRDIQALLELGLPIISMTGSGYTLAEGYFLPPLQFGIDEAFMLVLGSDVMAQNFDAQYRLAAQSARRKIETILSEKLKSELRYLQDSISFMNAHSEQDQAEMRFLPLLRRAIIETKTVRVHYRKRFEDNQPSAVSQRDIDPYGVKRHGEAWYLVGFCHLSQEVRNFRLSRIQQLSLLSKTFSRPIKLSMSLRNVDPESRNLIIRVLFDPEAADRLSDARSFYIVSEVPHAEGMLVTLKVRNERDALYWLLSWGSHIRVLEPASLRQLLVEEGRKIQQSHEGEPDPY